MESSKLDFKNILIRSKSLNSLEILDNVSNGLKVFQQRLTGIKVSRASRDSDWAESSTEDRDYVQSPAEKESCLKKESVTILQGKIEKLSDLLIEQQKFLVNLKKDLKRSVYSASDDEAIKSLGSHAFREVDKSTCKDISPSTTINEDNDQKRILLDAIELKNAESLEREIKDALTNFLQSDALKNHLISATEMCVKDAIRSCFSQNFPSHLPMLERSHRRLLDHVTKILEDTLKDLEEKSEIFSKSVNNTTISLRKALERHQTLLEEADENRNLLKNLQKNLQRVLQQESKEWRENFFNVLITNDDKDQVVEDFPPVPTLPSYAPVSPPQPANPGRSILEQLMKSAEINKEIKEGHVNSSFEKALSSADLSLVMVACRTADPAKVFSAPCKLRQSVLLSLIQQLATDMVHDTQLKCRYLEEAIINLNTRDPVTRIHLPTIVTEVQKHLTKFLKSYPRHIASRRVTLILMAANDLLKLL